MIDDKVIKNLFSITHRALEAYNLANEGLVEDPQLDKSLPLAALNNPQLTAEHFHDMFVFGPKKDDGWEYGKELDEEAKKSPLLVPFRALEEPVKQRYQFVLNIVWDTLMQYPGSGYRGVRPVRSRVLVRLDTVSQKTASGVYRDLQDREENDKGLVVAVGPGEVFDGSLQVVCCNPGDYIKFAGHSGHAYSVPGDPRAYRMIQDADVYALETMPVPVI